MQCKAVIAHESHTWRMGWCPGISQKVIMERKRKADDNAFALYRWLWKHGIRVSEMRVRRDPTVWRQVQVAIEKARNDHAEECRRDS